jgi:hypothetical protein
MGKLLGGPALGPLAIVVDRRKTDKNRQGLWYSLGMRAVGVLVSCLILGACSLEAKMTLQPTGAVGIESLVTLKAPAKDAWKNLRDLDPSLPSDPFAPELWQRLGPQARIVSTNSGTTLSFVVSEPRKLFPGLKTQLDEWDLLLDRATVRKLASMSSWGDSPALDSLVPSPETQVTDADYRDLLVYFLGPNLSSQAAKALVDASTVQLTLVAPRPLASAEGAVSVTGNQAVYRWPLVRVLALTTPIRLHLTF